MTTQFFNVQDYGAFGDRIHDDSAAFQAAIDACVDADGGAVYIPEGYYSLRTPPVWNASVVGAGVNAVFIDGWPPLRKRLWWRLWRWLQAAMSRPRRVP